MHSRDRHTKCNGAAKDMLAKTLMVVRWVKRSKLTELGAVSMEISGV